MGYVGETERHRKIQWDIIRDGFRKDAEWAIKYKSMLIEKPELPLEEVGMLSRLTTTDNRQKYIAKRMKLEGLT